MCADSHVFLIGSKKKATFYSKKFFWSSLGAVTSLSSGVPPNHLSPPNKTTATAMQSAASSADPMSHILLAPSLALVWVPLLLQGSAKLPHPASHFATQPSPLPCNMASWRHHVLGEGRDTEDVTQRALQGGGCMLL